MKINAPFGCLTCALYKEVILQFSHNRLHEADSEAIYPGGCSQRLLNFCGS